MSGKILLLEDDVGHLVDGDLAARKSCDNDYPGYIELAVIVSR